MKNLDTIATELFNKIRGRFPSVTVGDESATITNEVSNGRFFEFNFTSGKKVSITLDEEDLTVMYSKDLFAEHEEVLKSKWFDFLKELRIFAKKRMLNFDTRDITKSNLDKRDYQYLSTEKQMSESKLYGTSRTSYQNIGSARMVIKHSAPINQESATGRNSSIHSIYIESNAGERFKYPYRHLNGARAMARHVAEGGNPYDTFGSHISSLSEELSNLRKFKTYMNRSTVMAEGLSQYMDVVNDRIDTVKKTVESLQKQNHYTTTLENFEETVMEDVPEDVTANWIDELTIRQFNEELKDVFPYIYKLVGKANVVEEIGPEDLLGEYRDDDDDESMSACCDAPLLNYNDGLGICSDCKEWSGPHEDNNEDFSGYDETIESSIESLMGQFAEGERRSDDEIYDKCWKGYRRVKGKKRGEKGSCKRIEGVELEDLDTFFEGRGEDFRVAAPKGDRITTDENPLVTTYDDEFKPGQAGISGHMNLKTYMSIIGISEKYQEQLAQAVLDAGRGKQISIPDEAKAGYDAERDEAGLKPRALWIELSQHHEAEKDSDAQSETVTAEEQAFEDFKMAAANAAAKGETEFEYPKGSGKMRKVTMDKGTAAKMLADSQMNESEQLNEFIQFLIPAATAAARYIAPKLLPTAAKGAKEIAKFAVKNPVKTTVGGVAAANPDTTAKIAQGAVDTAKGVASAADTISQLPQQAADTMATVQNNVKAAGNKVAQTADELKAMAGGALDKLPNIDNIVSMAKKHALPAAVVLALLFGGYKVFQALFGKGKEKESFDDEPSAPDEISLEEFVKTMYDYTQNSFPKGETAVLTAVQKQYGDSAVDDAQEVITTLLQGQDKEMSRIQQLAGLR